jgi:hypothetical protein
MFGNINWRQPKMKRTLIQSAAALMMVGMAAAPGAAFAQYGWSHQHHGYHHQSWSHHNSWGYHHGWGHHGGWGHHNHGGWGQHNGWGHGYHHNRPY